METTVHNKTIEKNEKLKHLIYKIMTRFELLCKFSIVEFPFRFNSRYYLKNSCVLLYNLKNSCDNGKI